MRKVGSDTPSSDKVMNSWLVKVPRLSAAYTPMGTPITRARNAATRASSSVAGKRSAISRDTLAPWRRLRPNSPLDCVHQEVSKLYKERFVQTEGGAQLTNLFRGGILAQQEHHGISHVLEQHEGDEGHRDHDNHSLDQAAQYKGKHRRVE